MRRTDLAWIVTSFCWWITIFHEGLIGRVVIRSLAYRIEFKVKRGLVLYIRDTMESTACKK